MTQLLALLALAQGGFQTTDGKRHGFASPVPTVFIFALTECPIFRGYVPELKRLAKVSKIVLVHVDPATTADSARRFATEYGVPFPAVVDSDRTLVKRFRVQAVPTAVLLTPKGEAAYVGRIDDRYPSLGIQRKPRTHDLRNALAAVKAGKPIQRRTEVVGCSVPDI